MTGSGVTVLTGEFDELRVGSSPASTLPADGEPRVAVLIPCRNEEATIGAVVEGFAQVLPRATIYVFDNGSRDNSAKLAAAAGAIVRTVSQPGKGNVVRRMFSDVQADCYILVDGDGTYDPAIAPQVVAMLQDGHDLINVARIPVGHESFRSGHVLGNKVIGGLLRRFFGLRLNDVLSGYKGCSRRLVKAFPVISGGFEIETELAVHALQLGVSTCELEAPYWPRPAGSASKLGTWSDGLRILRAILRLLRYCRPMAFFGAIGFILAITGVALGIPILVTFIHTGRVPRFPTAILATGLEILAVQFFATGLALDTVSRVRHEQRMLAFLAVSDGLAPHRKQDSPLAHSNRTAWSPSSEVLARAKAL